MEGIEEGKESKVPEKGEVVSVDKVSSTSIKKGVPCSDPKLLSHILQKSQQAAFSSQSTLEANCQSVGLVLHGETPADGNCFFEAVSSQLRRLNCVVQKSPQQLRQEVVAFMRTNRVIQASEGNIHLDSFIYNESFDVYCTRMARDSEWADHVVVVAMARMLQMDIMIVTSSPSSGPENIIVWVVGQTAFQEDPILLGHVWESHYMSLQPIAHVALDQNLAGHSTQAQTDVPTTAPTAHNMQIPVSGSTSSTAVGLIQAQTTNASTSISSVSTSSTTPDCKTSDVLQISVSSFATIDVMQFPIAESTTADIVQIPAPTSTTADVMPLLTSPPTVSTNINGLVQAPTTGSTPTLTSTTDGVMQTATSSFKRTDLQTSAFGSTKAVMQAPTYVPTTTNVLLATTSASTPSTTTGSTPCPTPTSTTAVVVQAPSSGSTTTDMQASASGSKLSTTTGSTPCPTFTSTTANVTQASSVDDTDRFMHIACLLLNVGSRCLRRLLHFHTVTPTCTLDQYIAKNRTDIDNLRKRRILNESQMAILFPSSGSTNLGDYDITLLSALFTNIVPNISPQQLNMIQFLRDKRNEIVAHAPSVAVNSNNYQTFWNDICKRLDTLSKQCNDPDFENEISREIQGIQVKTFQDKSLHDTLQTLSGRVETLERLVQDLISSHAQ